ncbi:hypothetical protein N7462_003140 [Penicillium macrosclerotiorum]|uniref:uncharacterized protein n=1 Tax=Penicillium macrosclerotiorum TaxID=303699 RepID=UPI002547867E|nr:uncharacterized protein N7462_003140 [Penicillium macrosclerotiorum]KAJ5688748.1 hypothetical protein N7462_003140 [Penicillium macrosclerotiorum]
MSRNFLPVVLAIGVGVFTGYYTFQPTFQQLAAERTQGPSGALNQLNKPAEASSVGTAPTSKPDASPQAEQKK